MDVQFSGAVDFAPLFNNMNRPALPAHSSSSARKVSGSGNESHASMLKSQESILGPLSGGNAAMAMSTELALNAGVGANVNVWA